MRTIRLLPLLCGLLGGAYIVSTLPAVAEARRRKKRRKDRKGRAAKKQAKRLFRQAQKHYRLGRFARARKLYEKAYELLPLPGFLYNIAQCHRMEKNFERAVFFYKSYLSSQSAARNRDMVMILITKCEEALQRIKRDLMSAEERKRADEERARAERLARLKAQLAAARRTPQPYLPPPEPKKKPLVQKWWFWTSIAGGVVALVVTGVVVGLVTTAGSGSYPPMTLGLMDRR
jgi:tetratricopeptide (TPR) repeat protein